MAVEFPKPTADQDAPIISQPCDPDIVVAPCSSIEGFVQGAVAIEACDVICRLSCNTREGASDQDLAAWSLGNLFQLIVRAFSVLKLRAVVGFPGFSSLDDPSLSNGLSFYASVAELNIPDSPGYRFFSNDKQG